MNDQNDNSTNNQNTPRDTSSNLSDDSMSDVDEELDTQQQDRDDDLLRY